MLYNKNQFSITNDKKKLVKAGKNWVVMSAFVLAMLGGGYALTQTNVQAAQTTPLLKSKQALVQDSNKFNNNKLLIMNYYPSGLGDESGTYINQSVPKYDGNHEVINLYSHGTYYKYAISGHEGDQIKLPGNHQTVQFGKHGKLTDESGNSYHIPRQLFVGGSDVSNSYYTFNDNEFTPRYINYSVRPKVNFYDRRGNQTHNVSIDPISVHGYEGEPYSIKPSGLLLGGYNGYRSPIHTDPESQNRNLYLIINGNRNNDDGNSWIDNRNYFNLISEDVGRISIKFEDRFGDTYTGKTYDSADYNNVDIGDHLAVSDIRNDFNKMKFTSGPNKGESLSRYFNPQIGHYDFGIEPQDIEINLQSKPISSKLPVYFQKTNVAGKSIGKPEKGTIKVNAAIGDSYSWNPLNNGVKFDHPLTNDDNPYGSNNEIYGVNGSYNAKIGMLKANDKLSLDQSYWEHGNSWYNNAPLIRYTKKNVNTKGLVHDSPKNFIMEQARPKLSPAGWWAYSQFKDSGSREPRNADERYANQIINGYIEYKNTGNPKYAKYADFYWDMPGSYGNGGLPPYVPDQSILPTKTVNSITTGGFDNNYLYDSSEENSKFYQSFTEMMTKNGAVYLLANPDGTISPDQTGDAIDGDSHLNVQGFANGNSYNPYTHEHGQWIGLNSGYSSHVYGYTFNSNQKNRANKLGIYKMNSDIINANRSLNLNRGNYYAFLNENTPKLSSLTNGVQYIFLNGKYYSTYSGKQITFNKAIEAANKFTRTNRQHYMIQHGFARVYPTTLDFKLKYDPKRFNDINNGNTVDDAIKTVTLFGYGRSKVTMAPMRGYGFQPEYNNVLTYGKDSNGLLEIQKSNSTFSIPLVPTHYSYNVNEERNFADSSAQNDTTVYTPGDWNFGNPNNTDLDPATRRNGVYQSDPYHGFAVVYVSIDPHYTHFKGEGGSGTVGPNLPGTFKAIERDKAGNIIHFDSIKSDQDVINTSNSGDNVKTEPDPVYMPNASQLDSNEKAQLPSIYAKDRPYEFDKYYGRDDPQHKVMPVVSPDGMTATWNYTAPAYGEINIHYINDSGQEDHPITSLYGLQAGENINDAILDGGVSIFNYPDEVPDHVILDNHDVDNGSNDYNINDLFNNNSKVSFAGDVNNNVLHDVYIHFKPFNVKTSFNAGLDFNDYQDNKLNPQPTFFSGSDVEKAVKGISAEAINSKDGNFYDFYAQLPDMPQYLDKNGNKVNSSNPNNIYYVLTNSSNVNGEYQSYDKKSSNNRWHSKLPSYTYKAVQGQGTVDIHNVANGKDFKYNVLMPCDKTDNYTENYNVSSYIPNGYQCANSNPSVSNGKTTTVDVAPQESSPYEIDVFDANGDPVVNGKYDDSSVTSKFTNPVNYTNTQQASLWNHNDAGSSNNNYHIGSVSGIPESITGNDGTVYTLKGCFISDNPNGTNYSAYQNGTLNDFNDSYDYTHNKWNFVPHFIYQAQSAVDKVVFHDDTNNQNIAKHQGQGPKGQIDLYDPSSEISRLESQGLKLRTTNYPIQFTYGDSDDSTSNPYVIHFTENTHQQTDNITTTENVYYKYDDGTQAKSPVSKTITLYTRNNVINDYTHITNHGNWNRTSDVFNTITSPNDIGGYTPDPSSIAAPDVSNITVNNSTNPGNIKTYNYTVYYHKKGSVQFHFIDRNNDNQDVYDSKPMHQGVDPSTYNITSDLNNLESKGYVLDDTKVPSNNIIPFNYETNSQDINIYLKHGIATATYANPGHENEKMPHSQLDWPNSTYQNNLRQTYTRNVNFKLKNGSHPNYLPSNVSQVVNQDTTISVDKVNGNIVDSYNTPSNGSGMWNYVNIPAISNYHWQATGAINGAGSESNNSLIGTEDPDHNTDKITVTYYPNKDSVTGDIKYENSNGDLISTPAGELGSFTASETPTDINGEYNVDLPNEPSTVKDDSGHYYNLIQLPSNPINESITPTYIYKEVADNTITLHYYDDDTNSELPDSQKTYSGTEGEPTNWHSKVTVPSGYNATGQYNESAANGSSLSDTSVINYGSKPINIYIHVRGQNTGMSVHYLDEDNSNHQVTSTNISGPDGSSATSALSNLTSGIHIPSNYSFDVAKTNSENNLNNAVYKNGSLINIYLKENVNPITINYVNQNGLNVGSTVLIDSNALANWRDAIDLNNYKQNSIIKSYAGNQYQFDPSRSIKLNNNPVSESSINYAPSNQTIEIPVNTRSYAEFNFIDEDSSDPESVQNEFTSNNYVDHSSSSYTFDPTNIINTLKSLNGNGFQVDKTNSDSDNAYRKWSGIGSITGNNTSDSPQIYNFYFKHVINNEFVNSKTITRRIHYIVNGGGAVAPGDNLQTVMVDKYRPTDKVNDNQVGSSYWQASGENIFPEINPIPMVSGYTPNVNNVPQSSVDLSNPEDQNVDVIYTRNGSVSFNFVDDDGDDLSGMDKSFAPSSNTHNIFNAMSNGLNTLYNQHYEPDNSHPNNAINQLTDGKINYMGGYTQNYTFYLKHQHSITNNGAPKIYTNTINYVLANNHSQQVQAPTVQTITFTPIRDTDLVTGHYQDNWQHSGGFSWVTAPTITNYRLDSNSANEFNAPSINVYDPNDGDNQNHEETFYYDKMNNPSNNNSNNNIPFIPSTPSQPQQNQTDVNFENPESKITPAKPAEQSLYWFRVIHTCLAHTKLGSVGHVKDYDQILRPSRVNTYHINKIIKVGKRIRFEFRAKFGKHYRNYYVTGNPKYTRNAYLQNYNLRNYPRFGNADHRYFMVRVTRNCIMYNRKHYSRKAQVRTLRKGDVLKVSRLANFGYDHQTRLHLLNGDWATANLNFITLDRSLKLNNEGRSSWFYPVRKCLAHTKLTSVGYAKDYDQILRPNKGLMFRINHTYQIPTKSGHLIRYGFRAKFGKHYHNYYVTGNRHYIRRISKYSIK